jgi:hypothetical protein
VARGGRLTVREALRGIAWPYASAYAARMRVRRPVPPRSRTASAVAALGVVLALAVAGPASAEQPLAPADLRVTPSGPTRDEAIVATWTVPDGAPAGTTARWRTSSTAPGTGTVTDQEGTSSTPGRAEIPATVEGTYTEVTVALVSPEDEEGPAATVAGPIVDRTAPGKPPEVRSTGSTLTWTDPPGDRSWSALGAPTLCAEGSATDRPFPFSERAVDIGPAPVYCAGQSTSVKLWLEDAAGNVSRENFGGYGMAVTPACIPQGKPPFDPGPSPRRPTTLALSGRTTTIGRSGRHRVTVSAVVPRDAAGRVRLRVSRRGSGPRFVRTTTATVRGGTARATFVVPRGVRRLAVRASFAATPTHAAASRTATLRVR